MTVGTGGRPAPAALSRHGAVGVITLQRPEARGAVNAALAGAVGTALEDIAADPALHAAVIIGTGPAFCAGMDLKAYAAGESIDPPGHPEWGFGGITQHVFAKPLIAAVNGPAYGGGFEMVLSCDLVVAAPQARFALPEVGRGLIAGAGGVFRLPRRIPRNVAAELVLTGRPIDARRAYELGLVNRIAATDDLLAAALELAGEITANGPLAVRLSKELMGAGFSLPDDGPEIWRANAAAAEQILASADGKEGALAFAQKRPPVWTGR